MSGKKRFLIVAAMLAFSAPVLATEVSAVPVCGVLPSGGVLATFNVGNEQFHALITTPTAIADALALWRNPASRKRIPVGRLACSKVSWNCPWHFYQTPSTVSFAEMTIEVCDGTPSYVDKNCPTFGTGIYCPWSAVMIELRECRRPGCPPVPR